MRKKFIAALVGSAGSQKSIEQIFDHVPHDDVSFVIVRHLPVTFRTQMEVILQRHSTLAIKEIRNGMVLQKDTIYIAPTHKYTIIEHDTFKLIPRADPLNRSADRFLASL